MSEFESLKKAVGTTKMRGVNLGDVGEKELIHISDDGFVELAYRICAHFQRNDEKWAQEYRDGTGFMHKIDLERAAFHQKRADKMRELISDEEAYKKRVKKALIYLEAFCLTYLNKCSYSDIAPFAIEDGKVNVPNGTPVHSTLLSQLPGISRGGLLASEWFGEIESEQEGRFCCFLARTSGSGSRQRPISTSHAKLFFDMDSPLAKLLFGMDFFTYEELKRNNPERIKEIFLPEIIELFEAVVEPLSPGGVDMHTGTDSRTDAWLAIPGGIPPQLVKGIMLSSKEEKLEELINECSELFPNAVIFDENYTVLRKPILSGSGEKVGAI